MRTSIALRLDLPERGSDGVADAGEQDQPDDEKQHLQHHQCTPDHAADASRRDVAAVAVDDAWVGVHLAQCLVAHVPGERPEKAAQDYRENAEHQDRGALGMLDTGCRLPRLPLLAGRTRGAAGTGKGRRKARHGAIFARFVVGLGRAW